ncbi:MAG: uracil-DNA glycosylase [Phycisphaerae bacterium]|nr:uracil-DNA glycosylase [Phycisphaerae bacterium]
MRFGFASAGWAGRIPAVSDGADNLYDTARQVLDTERRLGGVFLPAGQTLPGESAGNEAGPGDAQDKAAALATLEADAKQCTRCGLCRGRNNVVFGEGDPDADLVFIGEAPGQEEDRQGRPFVGRAGELLTKMIQAMGLTREDVYIANVLKCRPPNNRTPGADEISACWDHLVAQLAVIRPKVIVTMGNPATKTMLDTSTGITRLRGRWQSLPMIGEGLGGTAVMPTFHPAYVLRQYTADVRGKVWSDLQQVMDALGLPRT